MSICSLPYIIHEYLMQVAKQKCQSTVKNLNTMDKWNVEFIALNTEDTVSVCLFRDAIVFIETFYCKIYTKMQRNKFFFMFVTEIGGQWIEFGSKVHIFICRKSFIAPAINMVEKYLFIPQQFNSTGILDTKHFSNNFHCSLYSLMHDVQYLICNFSEKCNTTRM